MARRPLEYHPQLPGPAGGAGAAVNRERNEPGAERRPCCARRRALRLSARPLQPRERATSPAVAVRLPPHGGLSWICIRPSSPSCSSRCWPRWSPFVVSRVRIVRLPIVVGEIAAGVLIGKSGLNLVQSTPTLDFLAGFGFAFLMFLSGLEVNFNALVTGGGGDTLRARWQRPVPLAILVFSATVLLALGIGAALAALGLTENAVLMGLILSTTSVGVVVPVLKERGLIAGPYGQTLLVTALISDFATLLLLSLTIAITRKGPSLDLLLFMILLVAFVAAAKLGHWARRVPGLTRLLNDLSHATAQIQVRGAFALMIIWVVLAEALGVETILGAFLAGAVISVEPPERRVAAARKAGSARLRLLHPAVFHYGRGQVRPARAAGVAGRPGAGAAC